MPAAAVLRMLASTASAALAGARSAPAARALRRAGGAFPRPFVLAAVLTAVLSAGATGAAQEDALAGRVAFVTPLGQLAVIDPDAGEPRLLTPVGTRYQFPAFAPGGDRIAAIGVDDGEGTVAVVDARTVHEAYRSPSEPPIYLYWSPSGAALSFIAARAGGGLGFWIADGAEDARLVAMGSPFYWSWSPDSASFLAHTGLTGPEARLAFADPVEGIREGDLDPPGYFQAPGISASGRHLAYAVVEAGAQRRVVVTSHPEVAGEVVRRAFGHEGFAMLGWHPSDELLAVMSPADPAPHWFGPIRLLDADDGLLETVVDAVALAFFWSPDGTKLAYLTPAPSPTPDVQQAAWRAPRDDVAVPAGLAPAARDALGADPRIRALAQLQERVPTLGLHVVHLDGTTVLSDRTLTTFTPSPVFVNQFLPFFDQYAQSHRIWSPDGDAIVLPMVGPDGIPRVVVVEMDGELRAIAAGDMPVWNVR